MNNAYASTQQPTTTAGFPFNPEIPANPDWMMGSPPPMTPDFYNHHLNGTQPSINRPVGYAGSNNNHVDRRSAGSGRNSSQEESHSRCNLPPTPPSSHHHDAGRVKSSIGRDQTSKQYEKELEEARMRASQLEKTMRWWSECSANWRAKWTGVRDERNHLKDQLRSLQRALQLTERQRDQALAQIDQLITHRPDSSSPVVTLATTSVDKPLATASGCSPVDDVMTTNDQTPRKDVGLEDDLTRNPTAETNTPPGTDCASEAGVVIGNNAIRTNENRFSFPLLQEVDSIDDISDFFVHASTLSGVRWWKAQCEQLNKEVEHLLQSNTSHWSRCQQLLHANRLLVAENQVLKTETASRLAATRSTSSMLSANNDDGSTTIMDKGGNPLVNTGQSATGEEETVDDEASSVVIGSVTCDDTDPPNPSNAMPLDQKIDHQPRQFLQEPPSPSFTEPIVKTTNCSTSSRPSSLASRHTVSEDQLTFLHRRLALLQAERDHLTNRLTDADARRSQLEQQVNDLVKYGISRIQVNCDESNYSNDLNVKSSDDHQNEGQQSHHDNGDGHGEVAKRS